MFIVYLQDSWVPTAAAAEQLQQTKYQTVIGYIINPLNAKYKLRLFWEQSLVLSVWVGRVFVLNI